MKVYIIRHIYFLYWKILIGMDYKKEWHFGRIMNLRYCIDRVVIISAKHLSRLFIDPAWCSIEGYSSPENPQGLTRASNLTFLWLIQWDQFEECFLSKLTEQVTSIPKTRYYVIFFWKVTYLKIKCIFHKSDWDHRLVFLTLCEWEFIIKVISQ